MPRKLALFIVCLIILSACSDSTTTETPSIESQPISTDSPDANNFRDPTQEVSGDVQVKLGLPFRLAIGQTARLDSLDLEIIFTQVSADSRCPSDVQCIWAGQVVVVVEVGQEAQALGEFSLILGHSLNETDGPTSDFDSTFLLLLDVQPQPVSTQPIAQEDYRAEFVVSLMEDQP